jgi:hypothetical protein
VLRFEISIVFILKTKGERGNCNDKKSDHSRRYGQPSAAFFLHLLAVTAYALPNLSKAGDQMSLFKMDHSQKGMQSRASVACSLASTPTALRLLAGTPAAWRCWR